MAIENVDKMPLAVPVVVQNPCRLVGGSQVHVVGEDHAPMTLNGLMRPPQHYDDELKYIPSQQPGGRQQTAVGTGHFHEPRGSPASNSCGSVWRFRPTTREA